MVGVIVAAALFMLPRLWRSAEPFEPGHDYRLPFTLSNDYWVYQRWTNEMTRHGEIAIIGDSFVWGEYVLPGQSLSAVLNRTGGGSRFANAGINGGHPLALEGLVRYYSGPMRHTPVVLHCNLLWMSSPQRDLRTVNIGGFNHPRLIPQLRVSVPAYQASINDRLSAVIDRLFRYRLLVRHLRILSYDGLDVPTWSLDHPYTNPLAQLTWTLPSPAASLRHPPIPWTRAGIEKADLPWLEMEHSLQWRAFRALVDGFRRRGAPPFVILGPFNEHLLTDASRLRYQAVKAEAVRWLAEEGVAFLDAQLLPSDAYGDASHPLAVGYEMLAAQLWRDEPFQHWLATVTADD